MADFACLLVANVMLGNVSTFTVENLWPKNKNEYFFDEWLTQTHWPPSL